MLFAKHFKETAKQNYNVVNNYYSGHNIEIIFQYNMHLFVDV